MQQINKILVSSDFLYSRNKAKTYGEKGFNELMKLQIKEASGIEMEYFHIDRQKFFDLSGIAFTEETFNSPFVLCLILKKNLLVVKIYFC